jgi:drug/metabolite transporter (DMT)-like permease
MGGPNHRKLCVVIAPTSFSIDRNPNLMNYLGEYAALATSFFFAMTAIIFASTGRSIGSQATNYIRLLFALVYLVIVNLVLFKEPLPYSAQISQWVWFSLSGMTGLSLGDTFFFLSLVSVGPRLGSLLFSLAPVYGSFLAWILFGETLNSIQILGIVLAMAGSGWVVTSYEEPIDTPKGHTKRGIIFGILAGLGQALGLIFAKQGMTDDFSPFQGNLIRIIAALIFTTLWTAFSKDMGAISAARQKPQAILLVALGAMAGPLLGVSASLFAIQHAEVGVASALMALPPVVVLPVSYFVFKEKVGWQAIAGTFVAILGVACLFLA